MSLSNPPRPISSFLQTMQTRGIETPQAILDREARTMERRIKARRDIGEDTRLSPD